MKNKTTAEIFISIQNVGQANPELCLALLCPVEDLNHPPLLFCPHLISSPPRYPQYPHALVRPLQPPKVHTAVGPHTTWQGVLRASTVSGEKKISVPANRKRGPPPPHIRHHPIFQKQIRSLKLGLESPHPPSAAPPNPGTVKDGKMAGWLRWWTFKFR